LTIRIPPSWLVTPFLGETATVDFPLMHVSTFKLAGPCGSLVQATQMRSGCFDAQWSAPREGVLLAWSDVQILGPTEYRVHPGRPVTIGRYHGKISVSSGPQGTDVDAAVLWPGSDGEFISMTGQVGPGAPPGTVTDVLRVLDSVVLRR
jgi:hypothetical protein